MNFQALSGQNWYRTLVVAALLQSLLGGVQAGAIRWESVPLPNLPGLGDRQSLAVTALNNAGQVAGVATNLADGTSRPFLYSNGQMLALGQPGAAEIWRPSALSDPLGVQGAIHIAGNIEDSPGRGRSSFVQQLKTLTNQLSPAQTFAFAGVETMSVSGINQSGRVVGSYKNFSQGPHAFTGEVGGNFTDLQGLSPYSTSASAINNLGMAVGYAFPEGLVRHAALWHAQTGAVQDLGSLGGRFAQANALNDLGVIVGQSESVPGGNQVDHAFIYRNGVMSRIADNLDQGGHSSATSINNRGQTLGWFNDPVSGNAAQQFLHTARNGAVSLKGLGLPSAYGAGINDAGQIQSASALYNPAGTLTWARSSSGSVGDADNWDSGLGFAPNRFLDVVIASFRDQTIAGDSSFQAKSLLINGSIAGRATLALSGGATVSAFEGVTIGVHGRLQGAGRIQGPTAVNHGIVQAIPGQVLQLENGLDNRGLLTGHGRIEGNVVNRGGGSAGIQVGAGQDLTLAGAKHSAADGSQIRVSGGGSLNFEGRLTHQGGATLQIDHATLRVAQGMDNAGLIKLGPGGAEIHGDINNGPRGRIEAFDGAKASLFGRLRNDGDISTAGGAQIVYTDQVTGKGSFSGQGEGGFHRFEGGYSPGASPASVSLGDVQFASLLTMELGGLMAGSQYDQLVFTGSVLFERSSFLEIALVNGFSPKVGDRFALFSYAQAPSGLFEDVYLPALGTGLSWDVSQIHRSGLLWVSGVPEPGSWALMTLGLLGLVHLRTRRSRGIVLLILNRSKPS